MPPLKAEELKRIILSVAVKVARVQKKLKYGGGGGGGGGFDTGLTLLDRVKEHSWDRQRVHKLTLMTSYMRGQGQVGGTVGTTKSHLYIYFVKTTFLAIFQPTSSMLLKDQSTFLFDNI